MTESALRCCLHISSASCGLAACDCAGHVVPSSSSRWQPSRRTSAGWPSSSPVRHRWPPHVWCERQSRCSRVDGVSAVASTERLVGQGSGSTPAQLASLIGDFCNKICQNLTHALQQARLYSITSSARASTEVGTSRPSAFAVLRLIVSSYLVGACTGRSAGFSPSEGPFGFL
jgi:hypothetical protein